MATYIYVPHVYLGGNVTAGGYNVAVTFGVIQVLLVNCIACQKLFYEKWFCVKLKDLYAELKISNGLWGQDVEHRAK